MCKSKVIKLWPTTSLHTKNLKKNLNQLKTLFFNIVRFTYIYLFYLYIYPPDLQESNEGANIGWTIMTGHILNAIFLDYINNTQS